MVGSRMGVDARVLTRAMEVTFSYPAQMCVVRTTLT
jgi:hypothetical protein